MTQSEGIKFILEAGDTVIFPKGEDSRSIYKKLAKLCHPDIVTESSLKPRARRAFQRLTDLYAKINGKPAPFSAVMIGKWAIEAPLAKGDIADLYVARDPNGKMPFPGEVVFKIARSPKDNDLMKAEADALTKMHADPRTGFKNYIPELFTTLMASGRQANVIGKSKGHHSLVDILTLFPDGLDFRHVIWMGNRLLSALGFAHRNGVVHGAILPQHLLYHPSTHSLVVVGWGQSVVSGALKATVAGSKYMYPKEVAAKRVVTPALDIYMAFQVLRLASDTIPRRLQALFDWCHAESPKARPQDAWELQDRWRALAKEEYGKPKYLELKLPVM